MGHGLPRAHGTPLPPDVRLLLDPPILPFCFSVAEVRRTTASTARRVLMLTAIGHAHAPAPHPCTTPEQAMAPSPRDSSFPTIPTTPTPAAKPPRCARLPGIFCCPRPPLPWTSGVFPPLGKVPGG
ncbi:hypothetical protein VPH35_104164 [Triticum aestivum]